MRQLSPRNICFKIRSRGSVVIFYVDSERIKRRRPWLDTTLQLCSDMMYHRVNYSPGTIYTALRGRKWITQQLELILQSCLKSLYNTTSWKFLAIVYSLCIEKENKLDVLRNICEYFTTNFVNMLVMIYFANKFFTKYIRGFTKFMRYFYGFKKLLGIF